MQDFSLLICLNIMKIIQLNVKFKNTHRANLIALWVFCYIGDGL